MTNLIASPLSGPPPLEIPLSNAPLERVIAAVQFTPIALMDELSFVSAFQDSLRLDYPFFSEASEQFLQVEFGSMGQSVAPKRRPIWQFQDSEKNWRVSLTSESVSLEVKNYSSRSDFLTRLSDLLSKVEQKFKPGIVVRTGMRYVNRIKGEKEIAVLLDLIKPDFLGLPLKKFGPQVVHSISETSLKADEGSLLLRMAKLPIGATIDPAILEPTTTDSFVIDIDVSSVVQRTFGSEKLSSEFETYANRSYAVFRAVITDNFIQHYGGEL